MTGKYFSSISNLSRRLYFPGMGKTAVSEELSLRKQSSKNIPIQVCDKNQKTLIVFWENPKHKSRRRMLDG